MNTVAFGKSADEGEAQWATMVIHNEVLGVVWCSFNPWYLSCDLVWFALLCFGVVWCGVAWFAFFCFVIFEFGLLIFCAGAIHG
eukprot:SAG11_NODE_1628_length_4547_cov_24.204178_3_plen_84_part_00